MNIKQIYLKNFRNYSEETIDLSDNLNIIIGNNAMGKTNLIESICCCGIGKSFKTTKYKELIKMGENHFYIKIIVQKKYREHVIEFYTDYQEKKRIKVDSIPLLKLTDLLGILNIVFFSPDEMKLIKESPVERRRFIDISLCQQNKTYLQNLTNYNKILEQRNKLLKEDYSKENIQTMLDIWDMQLIEYGTYIIEKRYEFVEKLKSFVKDIHKKLTAEKEDIVLEYESFIKKDSFENMKDEFNKKLKENVQKDLKLQYTSCGPHRDDLDIKVNDIDVRKFGSQGQQRTTALSLKLAEIELFKDETKETPVLLLDDVLSELDENRRKMLMEFSSKLQTIITCTDFDMEINHKEIKIENGKVLK